MKQKNNPWGNRNRLTTGHCTKVMKWNLRKSQIKIGHSFHPFSHHPNKSQIDTQKKKGLNINERYLALFSQFVEGRREASGWNCGEGRHWLEDFGGNCDPLQREPKTRTKQKMCFGFTETETEPKAALAIMGSTGKMDCVREHEGFMYSAYTGFFSQKFISWCAYDLQ